MFRSTTIAIAFLTASTAAAQAETAEKNTFYNAQSNTEFELGVSADPDNKGQIESELRAKFDTITTCIARWYAWESWSEFDSTNQIGSYNQNPFGAESVTEHLQYWEHMHDELTQDWVHGHEIAPRPPSLRADVDEAVDSQLGLFDDFVENHNGMISIANSLGECSYDGIL